MAERKTLPVSHVITMLDDQERALVDEAKRIEFRLKQVRTARTAMLALVREEPTEFDGKLIDACRVVLLERDGKALTPIEIRDRVKGLGYDFSGHPNEMAAVHGVLKRLVEYREAETREKKNQPGKRYDWTGGATLRIGPTAGRMLRDQIPQPPGGLKRGGD